MSEDIGRNRTHDCFALFKKASCPLFTSADRRGSCACAGWRGQSLPVLEVTKTSVDSDKHKQSDNPTLLARTPPRVGVSHELHQLFSSIAIILDCLELLTWLSVGRERLFSSLINLTFGRIILCSFLLFRLSAFFATR